jgi:hypothetical protein
MGGGRIPKEWKKALIISALKKEIEICINYR